MDEKNSYDHNFLRAVCSIDISSLLKYDRKCLREVLPMLTRCALCCPVDQTEIWYKRRQLVMKFLLDFPAVNFLVDTLSTDFNEVLIDTTNHVQIR